MDNQWQDPLLLTDVPWLEHSCDYISMQEQSLRTAEMADPGDFHSDTINEISWQEQIPETTIASKRLPHNGTDYISWEKASSETIEMEIPSSRVSSDTINGWSLLGYSLTSPDFVICAGSPDMHNNEFEETPVVLKIENRRNMVESIEFSLQQDINGSLETQMNNETRAMNMMTPVLFSDVQTSKENVLPEVSLKHLVIPSIQEKVLEISHPVLSINAGGTDMSIIHSGIDFIEDNFFSGGDVIKTETRIGYGEECLSLYQTARIGNFLYKFQTLEAGNYVVDLHLAEIIFTDGPAGMRVFDVFIQEEKVFSGVDIYCLVGPNKPLVLSNLKAFVNGIDGLSIRFESVIGSPIVCGISIKKDHLEGSGTVEYLKDEETSQAGCDPPEDECNGCKCKLEGKIWKLQRDYRLQYQELTEIKRAFEELTRENELKSKECQEAWMSLRELQNELMRKSMHVGSLAYAIEGQVKEKSRWFSSFRDVTKKFKILKIEHIKLSEEALECKKCLADMTQMTTTIQSALNQHVDLEKEHMELKLKFIESDKERKELYNKVLELKGNIRVFCRCRPLNTEEVAGGASMAVDFESAKDGELAVKTNGAPKKLFKFDAVFSPQADQADVFEDTAPLATSVLDGYNVCIFAYGQTGTGKTFTMEGTEEARGVNYRTLAEVFRIIRDRQGLFNYEISVSVLEVYNEQIRDLLVPGFQPGTTAKRLEVRQVADGIHHVPGLVEAHVNNVNEVWEVLQTGSNARAVGLTNANEHSSRSHCIHCVMVKGENMLNGECTRSKLWLVDLAGSERITKTEVQGDRLKETQNINRSLSALGDVISALATKSPHIPFRNSKLTHLLQDSLGGDSKTLMFVQISPNENDLSETLCSLNFASRVRGIEFGPAKKQFDSSDLSKYKQMAEKSKQDMKSKDGYIKKLEETIHNLELKMKARDLNNKNLQDKVKELESQFLIERKLARQHVDTKIAEQQQQQEEQHTVSMKPQVAIRQFGSQKNVCEPTSTQVIRPLTENNYTKPPTPTPPTDNFSKYSDPIEKENKPEMAEQPPVPRRTGRASICTTTTTRQVPPAVPFPRRNSLIPLPTVPSLGLLPQPSLQPLPPFSQADPINEYTEGVEGNCSEQITGMNRGQKSGTKKLSSILRRSLQKKIYIKSPMQQHIRRGGVNVGMEKVRLSIGGRGRMAQRVLLTNANKGQKEMVYMKQNQKEKERGWNLRTTTKTVF